MLCFHRSSFKGIGFTEALAKTSRLSAFVENSNFDTGVLDLMRTVDIDLMKVWAMVCWFA